MKIKYWINLIIGVIVIIFIIVSEVKINKYKQNIIDLTEELNKYKEIDNPFKGEIDSLKDAIRCKDSIIAHITNEYVKDVEWVENMPDSAAVALFNQLVWANSEER